MKQMGVLKINGDDDDYPDVCNQWIRSKWPTIVAEDYKYYVVIKTKKSVIFMA